MWEWAGQALDEGDDAAAWFSDYLNRPCRLVRFAPGAWLLCRKLSCLRDQYDFEDYACLKHESSARGFESKGK